MFADAVACETQFAEDLLRKGVVGLLAFMELQDIQEVANFFERRASAYQVGIVGEVAFDAAF